MELTICGGGNLGHACAAFLSAREGCSVTVCTRHPEAWSSALECRMPDGKVLKGRPFRITSSAREAAVRAEVILLCLPGFAIKEELERLKPFLSPSTVVGSIVSSTGFFFIAHDSLPESQPLFGFQRVPFICRTEEYGRCVEIKGTKTRLYAALENLDDGFCGTLEELFGIPVEQLADFYEASLTNSNPLLHTSRLYTMWKDWDGTPYAERSLFYEGWTEEAAALYIEMDGEFQELLRKLGVREGAIPPVLDYYESSDAASLAAKLRSIDAFKGILSPMKKAAGGYVPDYSSRYFTEDFPYGLRFIHDLAHGHGAACPRIDEVYEWGMKKAGS